MTEAPSTVPFHRRRPRLFLLLLTVAGALVLLGMVVVLAHASTAGTPAAATTVTTTATVTTTQPAAAAQTKTVTTTVTVPVPATGADGVSDGTYEVGPDIHPGAYKTRGEAQEGGECYWARMSSSTAVIAEHKGAGPQLVTIKASDKYFRTGGCQPWRGASHP